MSVYALFQGDFFFDIPAETWYLNNAERAAKMGLIQGVFPYQFGGELSMSHGMVVTILARYENADLSQYTSSHFSDVDMKCYYGPAVAWAEQNQIIDGTSPTTFAPDMIITREEFLKITVSYIESKGHELPISSLNYSDAWLTSNWAQPYMEKAQGAGLIKGFEDGSYRPKQCLTRAEGVEFLMRSIDCLQELSG